MALITPDELARGALLVAFGGAAGACTLAWPGSPLWLVPAALGVVGGGFTVPEIRTEVVRVLPGVAERLRLPEFMTTTPNAIVRRSEAQPAAAVATPTPATARPTAARPRWLEVTNDHPDQRPHALIIGPTGAGKTTMAKAIIGDRGGRTVVLAPKISNKGWKGSGAEVISLDRDATYAPITQALQDIDEEKRARSRRLQEEDDPRFEPLTVVLDDIQDLVVMEPAAGALMVNLSSIGRELNMRLIGIGTTDDALNVRGWKASRNNYVRIETDVDRRGTLSDGKRTMSIQAQESKRLAEASRLRPWRGEPEPATGAEPAPATGPTERLSAAPDDLLASLLALPADVRAAVPDISPERAARLARAMASVPAQGVTPHQDAEITRSDVVTVTHNDNGNGAVTVNVTQVAAGRAMPRGGRGVNVKARRLRGAYRKAGAEGVPFRRAYKELGGSHNEVFKMWQEGKAGRP